MTIEDVFDEFPVLYILAHALEAAREAMTAQWRDDVRPEDFDEEIFDYFDFVNEEIVIETMARLQNRLTDPAWCIIKDCFDFDLIRYDFKEMEPWAQDAEHAIRLVCLYGACLRMNRKKIEEFGLSAHELMGIRAKEAAMLARASANVSPSVLGSPLEQHS